MDEGVSGGGREMHSDSQRCGRCFFGALRPARPCVHESLATMKGLMVKMLGSINHSCIARGVVNA